VLANLQIFDVLWSRFLTPQERDRFFPSTVTCIAAGILIAVVMSLAGCLTS
jgi:hypothetical protein